MADGGTGATQEYIITALLQLLHKKAFSQISVTELCRKAGVSRMSFYRYFESREDVLKKFREAKSFFGTLAHAESVSLQKTRDHIDDDAFSAIIPGAVIYIPFADLIDKSMESIIEICFHACSSRSRIRRKALIAARPSFRV